MGVIYLPLPLDGRVAAWLADEGVPAPPERGRWPSPNELRRTLGGLCGYRVSYRENTSDGWDAEIVDAERGYEGWSTTIWVRDIADSDRPNEFSFHKGWPELALLIVERLARSCGPFVLVCDAVMAPVIVQPGCDLVEWVARLCGMDGARAPAEVPQKVPHTS